MKPGLAALLALTPLLPAQEWQRVRALLADGTAATGRPDVLIVVRPDQSTFVHVSENGVPGDAADGSALLPLAGSTPIALAYLLEHAAAEDGWKLDEPIASAGSAELAELGEPFSTLTWRDALDGRSKRPRAYRFLTDGAAGRTTAEFLTAHALDESRWYLGGLSHIPFAILQRSVELRSGGSFDAWVRKMAKAAGLASLQVGGPPVAGLPDSEIDAAFDLRISVADAELLLRRVVADTAAASFNSDTTLYSDYSQQVNVEVLRRTGVDCGSVHCAVEASESPPAAWLAWSNDPSFDPSRTRQAIVLDMVGWDDVGRGFLGLGGRGSSRPTPPIALEGVFATSLPGIDTPPLELELSWQRQLFSIHPVVRASADGPFARLDWNHRGDLSGELHLDPQTTIAIKLNEAAEAYTGVATVVVEDRSMLPFRVRFAKQ